MNRKLWRAFGAVLLWSSSLFFSPLSAPAWAEEVIRSFYSDIVVHDDGSMTVTETITVNSDGHQIKHGIYRDFPTRYKDSLGNNYVVDFQVTGVLRDGQAEGYHFQEQINGQRVYIGKKEVLLPSGEHTYVLIYQTNRQLGFFKDYDELYWNVTGNGWEFPMEKVAASVRLPGRGGLQNIGLNGYTGPQGSQGRDFSSSYDSYSGKVNFAATRLLHAREGLTIVVSWPKGYVREPSQEMKLNWFLSDNRGPIIGFVGLLIILGYYLMIWLRFGRDPVKGTIIPLYSPPDKMSPADVRYVMKMGYDQQAFTAVVLNMAVKGYLTINEDKNLLSGKVYTLRKTGTREAVLSQEEQDIASKLFSSGSSIVLENTNHEKVKAAIKSLKKNLKDHFEQSYFLSNVKYFIPGLLASVLLVYVMAAQNSAGRMAMVLFMSVWLSIWSLGTTALVWEVLRQWKHVFSGNILSLGSAIFISVFAVPFVCGEIFGIGIFVWAMSVANLPVLAGVVFINLLFYHLLKAPTLAGRKVMDQIEGFKLFLSVAEKDRWNLSNPPERTPELFEKYLPYALALDVEQRWSQQFNDVLARAAQTGSAGYSPAWYHGSSLSSLGAAGFASGLGSSLSSAISSSSTAPGSSSGGGGGGSSGGGGGGGGGGGW